MSDQPFQKCACQHCGGPIEFPAQGVGLSIDCPHCNGRTLLTADVPQVASEIPAAEIMEESPVPASDSTTPTPKSKLPALVGIIIALAVLGGSAAWYFKAGPGSKRAPAESDSLVRTKESPETAKPDVNADAKVAAKVPTNATVATKEKSLDDLKAGPVTLEKAKSGNLIYAVGKLKNDSSHQRFGVKIEIECKDAKGRPAGKVSDYIQVIEPNQEWRFHALILDSKATTGAVVDIQEDN